MIAPFPGLGIAGEYRDEDDHYVLEIDGLQINVLVGNVSRHEDPYRVLAFQEPGRPTIPTRFCDEIIEVVSAIYDIIGEHCDSAWAMKYGNASSKEQHMAKVRIAAKREQRRNLGR